MDVLIFKTDIKTKEEFSLVKDVLFKEKNITDCTIDLFDVDNVLRIVGEGISVQETELQIHEMGYLCRELDG